MANIIVKGDASAQLVAKFPTYNAETKTYTETHEYRGIESAIRGLEQQMQSAGYSYRITHDGPIWTMQIDIPQQDVDESIDRWEIFTESTEKSLFELPQYIVLANEFDSTRTNANDPTFRAEVENTEAVSGYSTIFSDWLSLLTQDERNQIGVLVTHLRSGVTGWQLDLVVVRRTRRVQNQFAPNYKINLDSGLLIYSTGQLNVPADVAFALPSTPSGWSSIDIFAWGWRKRSQRTELVGNWVEQTIELVFAPWSLSAYSRATSSIAW
jgi:hypothetical protein